MNSAVHWFALPLQGRVSVTTCEGAVVLSAAHRGQGNVVYMQVNRDVTTNKLRHFECVFTGQTLPPDTLVYVGTILRPDGLVVHVYEVENGL